jgi:hypothetical protein
VYVDVEGLQPSRWGLLDAANISPRWDDHMRNGVEWQPICGGGVTRDVQTCAADVARTVVEDTRPVTWSGPISVYKSVQCAPDGAASLVDRATAALALGESAALETAIWGPEEGDDSHRLWGEDTVVISGTASSLVEGLGVLEAALYPYGEAVIHAPRQVAAWAGKNGIIRWDQRPVTWVGNRWSFGAYPGSDADGVAAAADTVWLIGTPQVTVWRSPVRVLGNDAAAWLDRTINQETVIATRTYVVGWSCTRQAVLVNLS